MYIHDINARQNEDSHIRPLTCMLIAKLYSLDKPQAVVWLHKIMHNLNLVNNDQKRMGVTSM